MPEPRFGGMNRRLTATAALLAAALALPLAPGIAGVATAAPATVQQARTKLELPRPTGRFAVGQDVMHLVDRSRVDHWAKSGPRELMVTMYYPARPGTGHAAGYLGTEEARLLLASRRLDQLVRADVLARTRVSSRADARPLGGRYPLVVLSPGFGVHRASLGALAEDLASRGYVVASVDHAYESAGTAFPGGRMLECMACEQLGEDGRPVTDGRAADVSFLLDRLTGRHPAWHGAELIDRQRIAMVGHSIGGAAAAATMSADRRVRAGVDLDGSIWSPADLGGRPFLLLGAESSRPGGDPTWDANWPRLDGWKRWLTVTGSTHFTFTDLAVLGDQLGLPDPTSSLTGARSTELTRRYVGAFLDLHLKGRPQPLLDGPSADAPEVLFHRP